jgi:hypothetical protein
MRVGSRELEITVRSRWTMTCGIGWRECDGESREVDMMVRSGWTTMDEVGVILHVRYENDDVSMK